MAPVGEGPCPACPTHCLLRPSAYRPEHPPTSAGRSPLPYPLPQHPNQPVPPAALPRYVPPALSSPSAPPQPLPPGPQLDPKKSMSNADQRSLLGAGQRRVESHRRDKHQRHQDLRLSLGKGAKKEKKKADGEQQKERKSYTSLTHFDTPTTVSGLSFMSICHLHLPPGLELCPFQVHTT